MVGTMRCANEHSRFASAAALRHHPLIPSSKEEGKGVTIIATWYNLSAWLPGACSGERVKTAQNGSVAPPGLAGNQAFS